MTLNLNLFSVAELDSVFKNQLEESATADNDFVSLVSALNSSTSYLKTKLLRIHEFGAEVMPRKLMRQFFCSELTILCLIFH